MAPRRAVCSKSGLGHSDAMSIPRPSSKSENGEEERALLQTRVALFWKVMFFIILLGSGLGAVGAVKKPGTDLLLTLASSGGCANAACGPSGSPARWRPAAC